MKLASLGDRERDGKLVVVSRDLRWARPAGAAAPNLRYAIENWERTEPKLRELYSELGAGTARDAFELDVSKLAAPLPRTFQWLDASSFHSHSDLLEKVLGLPALPERRQIPLMYQGAADDLLGPVQDVPLPRVEDEIDFEAEIGVITDRVPMGTQADAAIRHVKLLVLINDWSLRLFSSREGKTGFGFLQAKPSTSFAPCAVTPDELGPEVWRDGRVHARVTVAWNEQPFGQPDCGEMGFSFAELIVHAAGTRSLSAGTIIGSGTVSNSNYLQVGSACIAERRAVELLHDGAVRTQYMRFGHRVRIEMLDRAGRSIFGAIDQRIVRATP